jgi:Holliday junction resolvasome RuvABC endonuclease subunit
MHILGIRTAPQQIRYAIVESVSGSCSLLNAGGENLIKRPAQIEEVAKYLQWVKDELHRVIRQNPGLDVIALKIPEFQGKKTSTSRLGEYLDAVVLLVAAEAEIPVITKLYGQMATRRSDVARHAEDRVGRTNTNWNDQMADAVAVAWIAQK